MGRANAYPHVVRLLRLRRQLEQEDQHEDLQLATLGDVGPRAEDAVGVDAREGNVARDVAREGDASRAGNVANRRKHRNAAVLQLGSAEPHERLVADGARDVERIPDLAAGLLARALTAHTHANTTRSEPLARAEAAFSGSAVGPQQLLLTGGAAAWRPVQSGSHARPAPGSHTPLHTGSAGRRLTGYR